MKLKYKALICDVDGTLIPNRQDGMPSQKVQQAIEKARKKIHIGVATARPYASVLPILQILKLTSPCVILGGAQILDPVSGKIFSEKIIRSEDVSTVWKIADIAGISLIVTDNGLDMPFKKIYTPEKPLDLYTEPLSLEKAKEFMQNLSHISTIAVHLAPAWGKNNDVHVMISHPQATKQYGILEIAEILGISTHEIIGIGEGYNDFPLLMACGFKVAMGNAVEDVKAIADYVAPSVENDGVADVIEKLMGDML